MEEVQGWNENDGMAISIREEHPIINTNCKTLWSTMAQKPEKNIVAVKKHPHCYLLIPNHLFFFFYNGMEAALSKHKIFSIY